MQVEREKVVKVDDFQLNYSGKLRSFIHEEQNPYIEKAIEVGKEHDIPEFFIKNYTEIQINGENLVFKFYWREEVESPEEKKKEIIAYIEKLPKKDTTNFSYVFVKNKDGEVYKELLYSYRDFKFDYYLSDELVALTKDMEEDFINGLNIDFEVRYGNALKEMFKYEGLSFNDNSISDFLLEKEVRSFIISEYADSLSDTLPREELISLYQNYRRKHA